MHLNFFFYFHFVFVRVVDASLNWFANDGIKWLFPASYCPCDLITQFKFKLNQLTFCYYVFLFVQFVSFFCFQFNTMPLCQLISTLFDLNRVVCISGNCLSHYTDTYGYNGKWPVNTISLRFFRIRQRIHFICIYDMLDTSDLHEVCNFSESAN